jgi:hypothetical protein
MMSCTTRDYKSKQCVYYETTKVDLNKSLIYECQCDERLKVEDEGSKYVETQPSHTLGCDGDWNTSRQRRY